MNYKIKILKVMAVAACIAAGLTTKAQAAQEMTINGIECVWVEAGTFLTSLGTNFEHEVTLTKDYWVSKYPVTQKQYQDAMGTNPSSYGTGILHCYNYDCGIGDNYPVYFVTWYDAVEFCEKVGGRLLTEAEWEYAARGGKLSKEYFFSGSNSLDDVAWFGGTGSPKPVGTKAPNELGIYDMSGNVFEWCSDWFVEWWRRDEYPSVGTDPTGPSSGDGRVIRGGSWNYSTVFVVENNFSCPPSSSRNDLGLRVAFNSYKIKFDANGGSAGDDISVPLGVNIGVLANATIAHKPTATTKAGYAFSGWWTAPSGGRQWDFANDIVTQDVVLYARWKEKEKIVKPTVTNTVLFYTGGNLSSGIAVSELYTITGGSATNVGNYSATVSLNDTANTMWEDGTKANITLSWSIAKAKITKPVVKSVLLYTGKEQSADIATNAAYTIRGGTAMYEGNHTALVTLNDTANYSWSDGTTDPLVLIWTIAKATAKVIKVVWGVDTQLVYNKMVQHPQWSIEPDIIDKRYLRINNARSEVGKYTAENNLAPYISMLGEYNTSGDYILTNTSVDYEIIPKPLKVALKDKEGKTTSEVKVNKATRITVGEALDSLKALIGYNGFAKDTTTGEADNAANSLSGTPKFEILKVESGTRGRSSVRDEGFKLSDFLDNGEYVVNIKVSDIFAQNYKLDDGQAVLKASDLFFSFSMSRDGDDTPIHQKQKGDKKYGILLEKAVVSQPARISVKTPEQAQINLVIYDNAGNAVYKTSGKSSDTFIWDLKNGAGRNVANGTYLIIAEAKGAKGTYAYSAKVGVKR
jgi:uncharacterized repeat protein (TIGR02543 family)